MKKYKQVITKNRFTKNSILHTQSIIFMYLVIGLQKKYRDEMEYLHNENIHVLFGSDHNYITKLLNLLS